MSSIKVSRVFTISSSIAASKSIACCKDPETGMRLVAKILKQE